jgi:hypothetical protein
MYAEELHMSKKSTEVAFNARGGTDRQEGVSAKLRSISAINEVLIHSTIGDDRDNWSDSVLDGLFEAQRILVANASKEVEALRVEYLALTHKGAA